MDHLNLRTAMARIQASWDTLTAGEGRSDEPNDVAAWVVGQRLKDETAVVGAAEQLLGIIPTNGTDDEEADAAVTAPDGFHLTDAGNAARLVALVGESVRYVHEWQRWIVYGAGRWTVDGGEALVMEKAKAVGRSLFAQVDRTPKATRDAVYNAAKRAESAAAISSMVRLARGHPGVIVAHEDLDADPFILNVKNGTVQLHTSELRPHDPADLCTLQAPVAFKPDAVAPLWAACLARWQPDPQVRDYLQREVGAGITGVPTETLSIHYGGGGNGKSKFWGAVKSGAGPYAIEPHRSLIISSKHEQHETVTAELFRVRLAVMGETSDAAQLDDASIKNLTGGDRQRARRMREDRWSFDPTHTLVMFSNYRPNIRGADEGIWRRVRLVDWAVTISAAERDTQLAAKLAGEAEGILVWMVEGARRFLVEGIDPPASVMASTADYRQHEDTVAQFLDEAGVVFERNAETYNLPATHELWCEDRGLPVRQHWARVTKELRKQGAAPERGNRGRFWRGIKAS